MYIALPLIYVLLRFLVAEQHKTNRRTRRRRSAESSISRSRRVLLSPQTILESPDLRANPMSIQYQTSDVRSGTTDNHQPQPPMPTEADVADESLAKTALTRFYHQSINGSTWTVFDKMSNVRVAYIGTPISNLSALVQEESNFSGSQSGSLHLPFPSIRSIMPWKPTKSLPLVKRYSSSFADDISALPMKDIRDNLVDSFFADVHPGFPIVDQALFRSQYNDTQNPPPILLLQAIFLVGAHVSNHENVSKSRSLVKMALFRRAKALFDFHYENDRMHLVQAALLFTWHFEGADDVSSNAYYWVGIACRIAFGLGMHRDLSHSTVSRMPSCDKRLYRRIFWTLFQLDTLASLHHGRPMSIDPDEFDQPPLILDDFIEGNQELNKNVKIEYCIQNVALCRILASVIKQTSPGSLRRHHADPGSFSRMRDSLDLKLAEWYLCLPTRVAKFAKTGTDFWSLQLQLHYNLALLHLHRMPDTTYAALDNSQTRTSSETCHTATLSITRIFDDISARDGVRKCWFTASTILLAAAIQISHEARSAAKANTTVLAIQAQNQLERLLPIIMAVSKYWSGAEAILHIYEGLLKQLKKQTQSSFDIQEQAHSSYNPRSPSNVIGAETSPGQRGSHLMVTIGWELLETLEMTGRHCLELETLEYFQIWALKH
jgi:transcriptional regulatory protein AMDR